MKRARQWIGALLICLVLALLPETAQAVTKTYAVTGGNIKFETSEKKIIDCDTTVTNAVIPAEIEGYAVTSIGKYAFSDCASLKSVTIPASVTSIGDSAFIGSDNLTTITVNAGNEHFSSQDGVLFNKDKTTLIYYPAGNTRTTYSIPDGVTAISASAFYDCSSLTEITIPNTVETIGNSAFTYCTSLQRIEVPDSVKSMGFNVFGYCGELTEVILPKEAVMSDHAFNQCGKLESVVIPKGTTAIGEYMFTNCTALTGVTIPDSVTSIGTSAFYGCSSLTIIDLPSGVTDIGSSAFSNCTALETIDLGDSLTTVGKGAFWDCKKLTTAQLPATLTSIPEDLFVGCANLDGIVIPDGVTTIGCRAFQNCQKLTSINIPASVTSIGESAFQYCFKMAEVRFDGDLPELGTNAMTYYCAGKRAYYLYGKTGFTMPTWNGFETVVLIPEGDGLVELTVFAEQPKDYCALPGGKGVFSVTVDPRVEYTAQWQVKTGDAAEWTDIPGATDISYTTDAVTMEHDRYQYRCVLTGGMGIATSDAATLTLLGEQSGTCGTGLTWKLTTDGLLTISGIGEMTNYGAVNGDAPWYEVAHVITEVVIEEGVTNIGSRAFFGCINMRSVSIPEGVTRIGEHAFADCTSLESVVFPESLERLTSAFLRCDSLRTVTIPAGVRYIGWYEFRQCMGLTEFIVDEDNPYFTAIDGALIEIEEKWLLKYPLANPRTSFTIPAGVETIGYAAFEGGAPFLEEVIIPEGVKVIGQAAFYDCETLERVTIPSSVTTIEAMAFYNTGLKSVVIPETVTTIESSVFGTCFELESVQLPRNMTVIPGSLFDSCFKLKKLIIPASVTTIQEYAFSMVTTSGEQAVYFLGDAPTVGASAFYKDAVLYYPSGNTTWTTPTWQGYTTVPYELTELVPETTVQPTDQVFKVGESATFSVAVSDGTEVQWQVKTSDGAEWEDIPGATSVNYTIDSVAEEHSLYRYRCVVRNLYGSVISDEVGFTSVIARGYCGLNGDRTHVEWVLDVDETLTVSGTGEMYQYAGWSGHSADIVNVVIEDGVTSIENFSFQNLKNLKKVTMADSVTRIGIGVFKDCTALTNLELSENLEMIDGAAFEGCSSLCSVTIPESVTHIGHWAFAECASLTEVTVPAGVTEVMGAPFANCQSLTSILVDSRNPNYCSVDGVLYTRDKKTLVNYPAGKTAAGYTVLSGVQTIGAGAFEKCCALTEIVLPEGLEVIDYLTFHGCTGLKDMELPGGVTEIGREAFKGCTGLTGVSIPNSVTEIGYGAFQGCTALTEIVWPKDMDAIGERMFSGCTALTHVEFPAGLLSILDEAFEGCVSLEYVQFPEGFGFADYKAFYGCTSLNDFVIYNDRAKFGDLAFAGCPNVKTIHFFGPLPTLGTMCFPDRAVLYYFKGQEGWAELNPRPFRFEKITESGTCGRDLAWTLSRDGTLTITGSGRMTDYSAESPAPWYAHRILIKSVVIDGYLREVGDYAFNGCRWLESVSYPGTKAQWDEIGIGEGNEFLLDAEFTFGEKEFPFAVSGTCGEGLSWELSEDGMLTIDGAGAMEAYAAAADAPWHEHTDIITSVVIDDGVTSIGAAAFAGCADLASVSVPASVTDIGALAFDGCTALTTVYFNGTATQWGSIAIGEDNEPLHSAEKVFAEEEEIVLTAPALTAVKSDENKPDLAWTCVEGAVKYEVWCSADGENFEKLVTVADTALTHSDAKSGMTYYYKVRAVSEAAAGTYSNVQSVTLDEVLDVPTLTVTKESSYNIKLSWTKVENAQWYEVFHSTDGENFDRATVTSLTTWTHEEVEDGVTHYYTVRPGNERVLGEYSEIKSATFVARLDAPTLTVTLNTAGKPYLKWTAVDGATRYEVYYSRNNVHFTKLINTSGKVLTHISAEGGLEYYYYVRAINDTNIGKQSSVQKIACSFDAPDFWIGTSIDGRPQLHWSAVEGAGKYELWRSTDGKNFEKASVVTTTSVIYAAAVPGQTYYYKVRAVSSIATGVFSEVKSVTVSTFLTAPALTVTMNSAGKPYLTWSKVDGAEKYEVWYSRNGEGFGRLITTTGTTLLHNSASAGVEYYYKVRTVTGSATGDYSNAESAIVNFKAPTVTIKLSTDKKPYLSWNTVSGATKYEVHYSADGKSFTRLVTTNGTTMLHTSADTDMTYYYKVRAVNDVTSGAYSEVTSIAVPAGLAAPQMTLTLNAKNKPYLTWTAVAGAAKYEVWYSTNGISFGKLISTTGRELTHTSAKENTKYYYKVRAVGGAYSVLKTATTPKSLAVPVLTASKSAAGTPYLTWTEVADATKYEVWCSIDGTNFTKLITTTYRSLTHSSAKANTVYCYKVCAINATAVSEYSAVETVNTAESLAAPTVTITKNSAGKPYLTWGSVSKATRYEIWFSTDGTNFSRLSTTTYRSLTHNSATVGTKCYYKVRAINDTTTGAYSSVKSIVSN